MDAALSQMLLAPWHQRDREAPWGRRLLAGLWLLGLAVALYFLEQFRPLVLALGACLVLGTGWMVLVGSLLEQNHPHVARFVPGHLQRLRRVALGAWALGSVASAGLLAGTLPLPTSFPLLLLGAAATCVFLAWSQRNWTLWLLLSFGPSLYALLGLNTLLAPLFGVLAAQWQQQPLMLLAAGLAALGAGLMPLFGDGNEAHRSSYARLARFKRQARESLGGKRAGMASLGRPGEWLVTPFERAASAWLARVLARSAPTEASAMSRAEIVLHGQQHWLRQAMAVVLVLTLVTTGFAVTIALLGHGVRHDWQQGAIGMAIGLSSMGFNPAFALPNMLWHSRREQALLKLLPAMPQGTQLNRAVAWRQLRQALVAWLLTTAALGLLATVADQPAMLCLALGALPLSVACTLRAPARMRPPMAWTAVLPIFGFFALGWGMYGLNMVLDVPLPLLAGLSLVSTAALGAWRWRAVCAAPVALPAGRLA
jgi:hypothetical protein